MMATSERSEEIKMIIVRKRQFGIKRQSFNLSTIKFFTIWLCHHSEQWEGGPRHLPFFTQLCSSHQILTIFLSKNHSFTTLVLVGFLIFYFKPLLIMNSSQQ